MLHVTRQCDVKHNLSRPAQTAKAPAGRNDARGAGDCKPQTFATHAQLRGRASSWRKIDITLIDRVVSIRVGIPTGF